MRRYRGGGGGGGIGCAQVAMRCAHLVVLVCESVLGSCDAAAAETRAGMPAAFIVHSGFWLLAAGCWPLAAGC